MAKSAYIHIPFCAHKCDFCDFAAFAGLDDLQEEYCRAVVKEIRERHSEEPNSEKLETVFFGGGTPGYVDPGLLELILQALEQTSGIQPDAEITLETTPHTITKQKCKAWLEHGIKRISIGIESMSDFELKAMGRDHSREQAIKGIETARKSGYENIAVDLMYGLPEQSHESWRKTLDDLLLFKPVHMSAYGLTIAQNSPLLFRYPRDSAKYPDEDCFEQMYFTLVEKCTQAGLQQYEIANFSLPGFESRHNLAYWLNEEYLAFGVGAHRYYRGRRSSNSRSLKRYIRDYKAEENLEQIDGETSFKEAIFLGLRLRRGLDLKELENKYGRNLLELRGSKIVQLQESGFLELDSGFLRLSQKGILVSNSILSELI